MSKDEDTIGCILSVLLLVPILLLNAFAIKYAWNSVIAVVFAVKTLNAWQAYGVAMVTGYLTHNNDVGSGRPKDYPTWAWKMTINTARPIMLFIMTFIFINLAGTNLGV